MNIREATREDFPAMVAMGRRFYESTAFTKLAPFDEASTLQIGELLLAAGVLLVAEHEGKAVGMVGLVIAPFLFNNAKRIAAEVMWWVDPDERNTGAGMALLRAVAPACKAKGADAVQMMTVESSPAHAGLAYRRLGFKPTETAYLKELT